MRFGPLRFAALLLLAPLAFACSGGETSGPDTPVPTTVTITSGPVAFSEVGQTATITATVRDQDGAQIPSPTLSFTSSNPSVVSVSSGGVATAVADGSTTITVRSGSAAANVSAAVTVTTLQVGQPLQNLSGDSASVRTFTLQVSPGAGQLLEVGSSGGPGDADIFIRFGQAPQGSSFDCASLNATNGEVCTIADPQAGTWFVTLQGFTSYSGLQLLPRLVDPTPLTLGTPVTGISASQDEVVYFDFTVPNAFATPPAPSEDDASASVLVMGTKPGSGATLGQDRKPQPATVDDGPQAVEDPTLDIAISGGTGDADLLATSTGVVSRRPDFDPGQSPECFPFQDGSEESCTIVNPLPGEWIASIVGFQAISGVSLSVSFSPGDGIPTPGTLTIQKAVLSSTGATANNPGNPGLSGYQFEVRPAGGGAVLATVTTDAAGVAQATLDPGSYDVVESDAQGLNDFTAAVNGVFVPNGGNVDVAWENRQAPPAAGNNAPIAVINASPRSVPSGDNNQTEVRLYGGNSTDANGDPLSYEWAASGGTFVGGTSGQFARITFDGGTSQTVSLTVSDGTADNTQQIPIAGTGALPAAGTFDIELRPLEPITDPNAQAAFDLAEATWESIVRDELPDVAIDRPENFCFGDGPAVSETIDDVVIFIKFASDDGPGGTLASAGPCLIRPTAGAVTPIVGLMNFDSDDFGSLSALALNRIILHEMAHVLGFGVLWEQGSNDLLINESCPGFECEDTDPSPDTRFIGAEASEAYRALGGGASANVPVENGADRDAGSGTRDGHWRESVFGTELMTGFLNNGVLNPLSFVTIASLLDGGYESVDFGQADNYSLPGAAPSEGFDDPVLIDLGDDIIHGPIWAVDTDGNVYLWREGR